MTSSLDVAGYGLSYLKRFAVATLCATLLFVVLIVTNGNGQNINTINPLFRSLEAEQGFQGEVLVARNDTILFHQAYGFRDAKHTVALDKNGVYNIASITKSFTAIAILKLIEQKRLRLADTLGQFFPAMPPAQKGISIHQLLTHQSGIPQAYAADGEAQAERAAAKIWRAASAGRPGEKFIYSNDNYALLAIVMEKITGRKWQAYVRETVLVPLGMRDTFFWGEGNRTGLPLAAPRIAPRQRPDDYGHTGATGMFSTAADLLKFQGAVHRNHILSDSTKALLFQGAVRLRAASSNVPDYYGYGFFRSAGPPPSIWARGNEEGWGTAIARWFPPTGVCIIVLSPLEQLRNGEKVHLYVSQALVRALW